jgi:hypothetical protein
MPDAEKRAKIKYDMAAKKRKQRKNQNSGFLRIY